ncbi:MAG TPA: EamA family transporter [Micromonosporaceae bacterium]|nr:EamA family transporter [Micromonosporaceae bacterium]
MWPALATLYLIWGSTFLAIRISVETLPPFLSTAARFGLAGLVLGAILTARRGRSALRVSPREAAGAALAGLLLLGTGNGLLVLAESGPRSTAVPSGIAALLIATVPLIVVVLRLLTRDIPPRSTVAGVLAGFAGLVVLFLPTGGSATAAPLAGALLIVLAATSWSFGSFLSRWMRLPADPFVAAVYEMVAGAAVLVVMGAVRGEWTSFSPAEVTTRSWIALAYLLVAGSLIAFTTYIWLLQHAPISLVSTYAYINPVVAVVLGALLVAEPLSPRIILGGGVIVLGVALVVSTERRKTY